MAAARAARARGLRPLPIPANYYDDLMARFDLPPAVARRCRTSACSTTATSDGDFTHFYTETVGSVFFEVVQRRGGYDGYGAANASVRLAAQRTSSTGGSRAAEKEMNDAMAVTYPVRHSQPRRGLWWCCWHSVGPGVGPGDGAATVHGTPRGGPDDGAALVAALPVTASGAAVRIRRTLAVDAVVLLGHEGYHSGSGAADRRVRSEVFVPVRTSAETRCHGLAEAAPVTSVMWVKALGVSPESGGAGRARWRDLGAMTIAPPLPALSAEQLVELLALLPDVDSVELKLTVPDGERRVHGDRRWAWIRWTPRSARSSSSTPPTWPSTRPGGRAGAARPAQAATPSSSCARSCPTELPPQLRKRRRSGSRSTRCPEGFVCSGTMKRPSATATPSRRSLAGDRPIRKLFSKEQRELFAAMRRRASRWTSCRSSVRSTCSSSSSCRRGTAAGSWPSCGSTRTVRGSSSCPPSASPPMPSHVARRRGPPRRARRRPRGPQQTKTKTALEFFAAELADTV